MTGGVTPEFSRPAQLDWHGPDVPTIGILRRQVRSLRIQSVRASPTLSRQFLALAEQYELRIKNLSSPMAEIYSQARATSDAS